MGKILDSDLLGQIELISYPSEHLFPRNVGLMLFVEQPEKFFPYSRVEIAEFPDGDAGNHLERAESIRIATYPYKAIEETVVNAFLSPRLPAAGTH